MNFRSKGIIAGLFILILHIVGIAGYLIPAIQPWFMTLTPWNLLITGGLIVWLHDQYNEAGKLTLLSVAVIGFSVEVIGVSTGFPFGIYDYGETLGFKVMEVPLIIGMNWLVLGYAFGAICKKIVPSPGWVRIAVAAALMTLADVLIEPVAIRFDYWSWQAGEPPLTNFAGWFFVAIIVQILLQRLDLQKLYRFSVLVILAQLLFFIILNLFAVH